MATIAEILEGHVTLEVECVDRLYLNGYIPSLATAGGLTVFMREHLNKPIPSPAVLGQVTSRFREEVLAFAAEKAIPLIHFERGERKDDRANEIRRERGIRGGVVFIGVAQEKAKTFSGRKVPGKGANWFEYTRDKTVCVNHYYFYVDDEEFGPAFIKVCSYAPWALKVCVNGHEWAKRQLAKKGIAYKALDNGFLECADAEAPQEVCDALGPQDVEAFLARWLERLPMPLTSADRAAGYDWKLSIWQMEVSRTQVFDRPVRGREFFEEVMRDNLDLGRPDRVQLIFERRILPSTPGKFRTRVIQDGVLPSLHIEYKSFDLKQYFKEGRALRTEGTFRDPRDFNVNKGLSNFGYLQQIGRQINRRLLEVERVSQNCGLSADGIQRVVEPTVNEDGQKAPGLRFGDPRVMALMLTLSLFTHLVNGFRNQDLRRTMTQQLGPNGQTYTAQQATYDLRRLCRKGLLHRRPGTHRYVVTPYGWKVARLYSRLEARIFRPALTALAGQSIVDPSPKLSRALTKVDHELDALIDSAFPATTQRAA
ncbi:MAG TPA: hypothetical protein VGM86_33325 [Thermoanaerobaculia bacterium]|jgi:hypothetical protein